MQTRIQQSTIATFLFGNTALSPLWLIIRVYVGYSWLMAGWDKVTSPVWTGAQSGTAIQGFLTGALSKTTGQHPDVSLWYTYFVQHFAINHTVLLSYMVAYGEVAVGVALIVGLLVGAAATAGMFMNFNYLFAGTVSINPQLILLELFLVLAWRTAGYLGADKVLLPKFFQQKKNKNRE